MPPPPPSNINSVAPCNADSCYSASRMTSFLPPVQFHKGHTHHLQGLYSNAKRAYEGILAAKSVPSRIRAMTLRQLGKSEVLATYIAASAVK